MGEDYRTEKISRDRLLDRVGELSDVGYRLVQIGCTKLKAFELDYSFDKKFNFLNLRVELPLDNARVPSISPIYWSAFLYENEIHDLFGIDVTGVIVDYKGKFYNTKVMMPFSLGRSTTKKDESPGGANG